VTDEELKARAHWLREASNDEAGPRLLREAMADVIDMAVEHYQDGDCYLCETNMKGECVAWCNGVVLAMAAKHL
jgi:hypothetical protein